MVGHYNHGVPTVADLENNSNQKKYTVNRRPGGLVISKPLCALMAIGALLLAILVGLLVFFFVPRCSEASPESLTSRDSDRSSSISDDDLSIGPPLGGVDEPDERLPRSIEPTHYRIQIMPYLNNLTTSGAVTMTLNVKEDTREIIFNVKDIEIDEKSVKIKSAKSNTPLGISNQNYVEGEKYKIVLEDTLTKNLMYTLELLFTGHLNKHLQGFYRSEYQDAFYNYSTKYLASTQFSPTDARRAFPCFDDPSFKANFSIVVARPSKMSSISNMRIEKSDTDATHKDWTWDYYETTPKMSTYLVAFIVSDLQAYGSSDKLIKVWSKPELISETRYAGELAPKVLHFFEKYFGIEFPLPKIDIVAVPEFGFNAMENWGLITFRESALLFNDQESDMDDKRQIAMVLSHELGHQWFGNLVTPKWWNDLWLKEGFATYLEYLGINFAEPDWNIRDEFVFSETNRAMLLDALESSRPISFEVKNNRQIRQTFDDLSYAKGACIIRMMEHFLGEETFKAGLINFLQAHKFGNADRSDLFTALTVEAHKRGVLEKSMTVQDVMDSWSNQPGFPVITAIADPANKKLIISQKRFLFTNKHNNATWWVPISVVTDANPEEKSKSVIWLKNEPMLTVDMNFTTWYLINSNQTGYYIVNYDEKNWRILTYNIMTLKPLVRAQLISDAMDLARANLLDYDIPLRMISRMAVNDEEIMFVPTTVAFSKMEFLSDILSNTPAYGLFDEYQSTIFKRTYRTVESDMDYYNSGYLNQRIRRAVLKWACKKTNSECAIKFHHMFRAWMEKNQPVPPNLRDIVYCTAIREGTEAEWNFAFYKYLHTRSVSEKNILLDALGCTTKTWLLSRYLDFLLQNNSSIRIQDADRVFKSVADNSVANTMAFDFLRMNWNKLVDHYGEGFNIISKMVKSLPRYMNTRYQLSELIRFRNEIKNNIGTASQAFENTIESVRGNVAWMNKNYDSVERWLQDHKDNFNL